MIFICAFYFVKSQSEANTHLSTSDPAVQEKHLQIYRTILTLVPGFSDMLTEYQFTPESLPDLLRLVSFFIYYLFELIPYHFL